MIITSASEPITIESGGATYTVAVPTLMTRASFRRALTALGATYHSDDAMLRVLRDGVKATVAEDQQAELLELIADFRDATAERAEALLAGEDAPDKREAEQYADLADQVQQIEQFIRTHHDRYAQMESDRGYYLSIAPIVAFKRFVRGWEGLDLQYQARGGEITDECMELVPPDAIVEIGWRVLGMMNPSRDDQKKAPSPSQSQPSQTPSTAESARPTAARAGKSRAKSTPPIPH